MKILCILSFILLISNSNCFKNILRIGKPLQLISYKNNFVTKKSEINLNKINDFCKLIRYKNILPTIFLNCAGGLIINPSIYNLFTSKLFIISTLNTIIIMSSSMVINDVYDIKIDKINNPRRPLISGSITIKEAIIFILILLSSAEFLNLYFLPKNLQFIIHLVIVNINLYTPIYKKIPLLKNIFCAALVSFSLLFSGLIVSPKYNLFENKNINLLMIAINLIFFGSLTNELLLDIHDIEGDKLSNIKTFPIIFGNNITWLITNIILYLSILTNSYAISYFYNIHTSIPVILILYPLLLNLYNIKQNNFSKKSIEKYMIKSTKPLFLILFYLCSISLFL